MNGFFSFFLGLWRGSQPFGWMGLIIGYFTLTAWYLSGVWFVAAWVLNPMTLRVCYRLYEKREDLDALADQAAAGIRARRQIKEEDKS